MQKSITRTSRDLKNPGIPSPGGGIQQGLPREFWTQSDHLLKSGFKHRVANKIFDFFVQKIGFITQVKYEETRFLNLSFKIHFSLTLFQILIIKNLKIAMKHSFLESVFINHIHLLYTKCYEYICQEKINRSV